MTDHVARDREEHGDHRRHEWWEKEDERQERKKLQNNTEYGIVHERIDRNILHGEHRDEYNRLECNHDDHDSRESDEFPENDAGPVNRLREHEIDRAPLYLSSDHPSAEEEDDCESCQFYEGEPKVIENALDLPECERLECEGDEDEDHTQEENEREKSISHEFSDGIESDDKHFLKIFNI